MAFTKEEMPETMYRASRYFRVLGNPTAYCILRVLGKGKKTPGELSDELDLSMQTVSTTLRHLRQIDLVRYDSKWKFKVYRIKDRDILKVLSQAEKYADKMRNKEK